MNDYYYEEGEEEKESNDYYEADGPYKYSDKLYDNYKKISLRASTAPARPLTEIEEFRRSSDFLLLEHTVMYTSQFIQRPDNKYDIDSPEGQRACKRFLNQIEKMCEVTPLLGVQCHRHEENISGKLLASL
jgi:hypothetical protein